MSSSNISGWRSRFTSGADAVPLAVFCVGLVYLASATCVRKSTRSRLDFRQRIKASLKRKVLRVETFAQTGRLQDLLINRAASEPPPATLGALGLRRLLGLCLLLWLATLPVYVYPEHYPGIRAILFNGSVVYWGTVASALVWGIYAKRREEKGWRPGSSRRQRRRPGAPRVRSMDVLRELEDVLEKFLHDLHAWAQSTGNPNLAALSNESDFGWLASRFSVLDSQTTDATSTFHAALARLGNAMHLAAAPRRRAGRSRSRSRNRGRGRTSPGDGHGHGRRDEAAEEDSSSQSQSLSSRFPRTFESFTSACEAICSPPSSMRIGLGPSRWTREVIEEGLPLPLHPVTTTTPGGVAGPSFDGTWDDVFVLLVPGLFTKHYPLYMAQLQQDLTASDIPWVFSAVDTDAPIEANAAVLRREILKITAPGTSRRAESETQQVVLVCHSKGACDAIGALAMYPELTARGGGGGSDSTRGKSKVAAVISMQGPHGGSCVVNDIAGTSMQKRIVSTVITKLMRSNLSGAIELSYANRRRWFDEHIRGSGGEDEEVPAWLRVPTVCLATSAVHLPAAVLAPVVEYYRYRYAQSTDGCVAASDAVLPGSTVVLINDMDHFGPAWNAFPARDNYDKTAVGLTLIWLALTETKSSEQG